jgi:hypothetical protein
MATQPTQPDGALDEPLSDELLAQLRARGIGEFDEVALRRELERHAPTYTLIRLAPAAVRKWKARYRILLAADYFDAQSAAEAYARAVLALARVAKQHDATSPTDA